MHFKLMKTRSQYRFSVKSNGFLKIVKKLKAKTGKND